MSRILLPVVALMLCLAAGSEQLSAKDLSITLPSYHPFKSEQAKELYLSYYDKLSKKWPVTGETKMIKTASGQTFIRISGPVDAAPLVLLPGSGANSLMWRSNVKALSEHFRVYAVDNLYDFGRSVFINEAKNPDDFSKWLNELFTELNLGDSVNLMGTSYGGWIAAYYAIRNPERLNKLVLLGPSATVLPIRMDFIFRALLPTINLKFYKGFFDWVFADLVHQGESGRQRIAEVIEETTLGVRCYKTVKFIAPTVLKADDLRNLKVSTLYVVGENEKLISAKKAVGYLNKIAPQIKTEIVAGAGHDLVIAQVERVDSLVINFLK